MIRSSTISFWSLVPPTYISHTRTPFLLCHCLPLPACSIRALRLQLDSSKRQVEQKSVECKALWRLTSLSPCHLAAYSKMSVTTSCLSCMRPLISPAPGTTNLYLVYLNYQMYLNLNVDRYIVHKTTDRRYSGTVLQWKGDIRTRDRYLKFGLKIRAEVALIMHDSSALARHWPGSGWPLYWVSLSCI